MIRTQFRCSALILAGAACLSPAQPLSAQTPEQLKMWEEQRAQTKADQRLQAEQLARQRDERKADPMAWVRTLDPMSAGGWTFRAVGADGSWAAFSTDHQMKRSGRLVTLWLRQEYPEVQKSPGGDAYWSDVQKLQYDCAKEQSRVLLVVYYAGNNLTGAQQTEESDMKTVPWDAIVPGTQSEFIFHWACAGAAR
jgi:hypothetical protein